jgi:histidyl-tRNA synthetase
MELQKPRGTRDFMFEEMKERKYVETILREVFEYYGYQEIKTPIFEDLELFTQKSGEGIVEEIYHFQDKGGRDLALRPELTAPVARLYMNQLQKKLKPIKMYYFGSCFRYERPQAGRFRQFWQFGCELIGGKSPDAEAELIAMAAHTLDELGLEDYEFHIGNLGIVRGLLKHAGVSNKIQDQIMAIIDKGEVEELKNYLDQIEIGEKHHNSLMQLIDMQGTPEIIKNVQIILEGYDDALSALNELDDLLLVLDSYNFSNYIINLGIARGLDYYTGTVFEIYIPELGAQKQISGGGTYNLIEVFGGDKIESSGFAFGFDRLMGALKKKSITLPLEPSLDIYVVAINPQMKLMSYEIAQNLRMKGFKTGTDLVGKKLKKILSYASKEGIHFVILVGSKDFEKGQVTLKNMFSGEQDLVDLDEMVNFLEEKMKD